MSRRGRRHKAFNLKLRKETIYSVSSILLMLMGVLVMLSFTQKASLYFVNLFLLNLFGWGTIFLPFLFFSAGLVLTRLKSRFTRPNLFIGGLLIFLSLMGLAKTGAIGLKLWLNLASFITGIGAFFILFASFLVGFFVLFDTSLEEIMLFLIEVNRKIKNLFGGFSFSKKPTYEQQGLTVKGLNPQDAIVRKTKEGKEKKEQEKLAAKLVSNVPGATAKVWRLPSFNILEDRTGGEADRGDLKKNAATIENTLDSFGIEARVGEVNCGPAVTQYCLEITLGTKLSKITALANDLALALAAPTGQIRIEAPIPGRSLVGVEIPNRSLEVVPLKRMLTAKEMKKTKAKLAIALGFNVAGEPVIDDIARMPHVLIAGSTGSGKSVCINSFIATILFRASPQEVKLILVDPKRVELTQYDGIPHLLTPVIVEPEKVVSALKWAIAEMERRYKVFAGVGARNIETYNQISGFQAMPYILIVIDELADIMFFAPSEVEDAITRIAQMARATGIHLLISTQRPSVDVITGLIKANIPCRIAFNVSSMVDSRVIIDMPGAEKLLGRGDMLYIPPNQAKPTRIQGAFVSDAELTRLIQSLKEQGIEPNYTEEVTTKYKTKPLGEISPDEERDELFDEAVRIVCRYERASASLLQRRLSLGYARAARILDQLYSAGIVSQPEGSKPREVLIKNPEEFFTAEANKKENEDRR